MSLSVSWQQIALRLVLTTLAGAILGLNRGERGRPAGLRTMILVSLAAALSMIEANLLLGVSGKNPSSFSVLDLMRFPLGILSGMGFIGAGVIIRRGDLVLGVTTAATLWFSTMMGLCFGGGQVGLGIAAAFIGSVVLWGFKALEDLIPQNRKASFLVSAATPIEPHKIRKFLADRGFRVLSCTILQKPGNFELGCLLEWRSLPKETEPPHFLKELSEIKEITAFQWRPEGGFEELRLHSSRQ